MAPFSRTLRRIDLLRMAAITLGLAVLVIEAAYVIDVAGSQSLPDGVVPAVALAAIAVSSLLYAWRLGAGGLVE